MVGVADERDEMTAVGVAPRLRMHLGDERADRVDDAQSTALAALAHRRRDSVRREDADLSGGDLVLVVDEDRPEPLEPADDMVVVDDLVPDVDRRAVLREQPLDDLDRAVDSGAKGARRGEEDALAHATASRLRSARRAPRAARTRHRRLADEAAQEPERTSTSPSGVAPSATPPSRCVGVSLIARRQPTSRPLRASAPDSMSTASAPVAACSRRPLRRVVDDPARAEDRPGPRGRRSERLAFPEHRAGLVDDARRVDHRSDRQLTGERARDPERHQPSLRHALRGAEPDDRGPPEPARDALLDGHGTSERQPVSVQAMLLALSLKEPAASYAADGSKPEWIAQCSQRGSLPGP